ncbi:hypothetical protein A0H81_09676 [Grifola frondosa]|uniref:GATA-type domain-containing protein n=1 Tax=Grifola frondosa TaxID=5627 RepID=A0A1C7M0J6_GRIFR|nr:hypothetical protein A0H81_09676 [Grifola frondosa]
MDSLQFDSYTTYSDASTPRTPSPRTSISSDDFHSPPSYSHDFKPVIDMPMSRAYYDHRHEDGGIYPEQHTLEAVHMWSAPYPGSLPPLQGSRGSLLEELYDHEIPAPGINHDMYLDRHQHSAEPAFHGGNWSGLPQTAHGEQHLSHSMRHPHDIAMTRRATFPDHDSVNSSPYSSRPSTMYSEPLSLDGSPHIGMCESLHGHGLDEPFAHNVPMNGSPHPPFHDYHLEGIKTEDSPVVVPSQTAFCRPPSAGMQPLPCLSPHAGLIVQHTDDAASKETQYLRRRCFNCHTTEPPSWRRSTLNPGKIVCNKCGLYERTHLRPRPLRFDELRAGSKTRKNPKVAGSPKAKLSGMVKKEPDMDGVMPRRSSVSSSSSSVHSATSDWDENVSVYSGSNPPSSYNSPAVPTFPIPRDSNSQSPPLGPRDGGIRLPNAPLSDIASLQSSPHMSPPRKSATIPYYSPSQSPAQQGDYYNRRGSLPAPVEMQRRSQMDIPIPEVTGWQSVPLSDLAPSKPGKPRSKVVA